MDKSLHDHVIQRADNRCEYCRMPGDYDPLGFQVDHIIARKHRGSTEADNLAWSCFPCNSFKGSDISSLDSETGELTRLFHPRRDDWNEHFQWYGAELRAITAVGRVTIDLLRINMECRVAFRRELMDEGVM